MTRTLDYDADIRWCSRARAKRYLLNGREADVEERPSRFVAWLTMLATDHEFDSVRSAFELAAPLIQTWWPRTLGDCGMLRLRSQFYVCEVTPSSITNKRTETPMPSGAEWLLFTPPSEGAEVRAKMEHA